MCEMQVMKVMYESVPKLTWDYTFVSSGVVQSVICLSVITATAYRFSPFHLYTLCLKNFTPVFAITGLILCQHFCQISSKSVEDQTSYSENTSACRRDYSTIDCGATNDLVHELESRPLEWRSAGTGRYSYRVRGVDGSCAKHLTTEFYTVVMLLIYIYLLLVVFHQPSLFHSSLKTFSANPSRRSLPFLLRDSLRGFPGLFTDTPEHIRFLLFSFSVLTPFSCRFRAVD